MDRRIAILLAAAALLSAGACSTQRAEPAATPPAPKAATPAPSTAGQAAVTGKLADVEPAEIRVVMVDLSLAYALDVCGFPALGGFIRDYTQKRIDSCPNSAERKAALNALMQSAALREQHLADEARANGETLRCYASDKLKVIKEMIPIAQTVVARAEKPLECGDISSAQR